MDILKAISDAQSGQVLPLYVVVGSERFLADRLQHVLREAVAKDGVPGLNIDIFQGRGLSGNAVVSAAKTLPMMSSRRFVLVREIDAMETGELDALLSYLENPVDFTCMVCLSEKLDGRSRFARSAKQRDYWVDAVPLKGRALHGFVREEAMRRGHAMDTAAVEQLVSGVGPELSSLEDAIERLSLFVGEKKRIDTAAVDTCILQIKPDSIWALVDAVSEKNLRNALHAVVSLSRDREPPLRILSMLSRQLRIVARMKHALESGLVPAKAVIEAGGPPFKAQALAQAARKFTKNDFRAAFETFAEVDVAIKSRKLVPELVLQETVMKLCRPVVSSFGGAWKGPPSIHLVSGRS